MNRIDKLLIANRGEIALRIQRTCREMGIATVAVFSDADEGAPFVESADEAVRIGPAPAVDSYLRSEAIVAAAARVGADAIHPGYGFLAENHEFAQAVVAAGLVFVGPPPEVIRRLGSKREAKSIALSAGVPVVPGAIEGDSSNQALMQAAREIGFPVLVKASAGGGGKGMRIVAEEASLAHAIDAARREAASAFGDDTLLIERYVESPRHVEIQILADHHGNVVHLFERECSIQRRHQKIIEECPSPALDETLRARMGEAALALARAVGYRNAGTVEFILAPDGSFYFLEVNTRLQVEHPVTELVTGLDLVREQLRIARGEPLDPALAEVTIRGWAVEARLYAEDPARDFLPAPGPIVAFEAPAGVRTDAGVRAGDVVGIHYDPLLAKVVSHAPSRPEALAKLAAALRDFEVQGVVTNRLFLAALLEHPAMIEGALSTHFLSDHEVTVPPPPVEVLQDHAIAATLHGHESRRRRRTILPLLEPGYRNNRFADEEVRFRSGASLVTVHYRNERAGRFHFSIDESPRRVLLVAADEHQVTFRDRDTGVQRRLRIARRGERIFVHDRRAAHDFAEEPRFPPPTASRQEGACLSPMPGKVLQVLVEKGQSVEAGRRLVILEAMKMEHVVTAPAAGVVAEICVAPGDQVDGDQRLVVIS